MHLRLNNKGTIDAPFAKRFEKIINKTITPFHNLIEQCSKNKEGNLDWWLTSVSSRDILISPLFFNCCALALLDDLLADNFRLTDITVNSRELASVIKSYLTKKNIINIHLHIEKIPFIYHIKSFLKFPFFYFLLGRFLLQWIIIKCNRNNKFKCSEPLTLIDTNIIDYKRPEYNRYYPGLWESLSSESQSSTYFIVTFFIIPITKVNRAIKTLRNARSNYLIKEDFLKLVDYLFVFFYLFRIKKLTKTSADFLDFDVSLLIKKEIFNYRCYEHSIIGLLNFRFVKNLKKREIGIQLAVDWFENQIGDKGWNFGFHHFFPKAKTIGYKGYIAPDAYQSRFATSFEYNHHLIPQKIAVIGSGLINAEKKYCPELSVITAPAYRFMGVWKKRKYTPDSKQFTILLGLPHSLSDSIGIVKMIASIVPEIKMKGVRVWIKGHPANSADFIARSCASELSNIFKFVDGDFNSIVEKSNVLVSIASSICLETLAKGIPVLELKLQNGISYKSVPDSISESIYAFCDNPKEVKKHLNILINTYNDQFDEFKTLGREIRETYFQPISQKSTNKLLDPSCN